MRIDEAHFRLRLNCPLCAASGQTILYCAPMTEHPVRGYLTSHFGPQGDIDWSLLEGTDFALAQCPDCDFVYQRAEPRDEMMGVIYTQMIGPAFLHGFEQAALGIDNFLSVAGELALLFRAAGKHPSQISFLDFGFGHGRWARVARAMGATVYGTEIGDEKRRIAESLGIAFLTDAQLDAMTFDIVHAEQVLEHVGDPRGLFGRLARATRSLLKVAVPPGGDVVRTIKAHGMTDDAPFARRARGERPRPNDMAYMAVQPLEHINIFTPRAMERLAAENGMRLLSRSRRQLVPADLTSLRTVAASMRNVGKEAARAFLKRDTGYYLFAPEPPR